MNYKVVTSIVVLIFATACSKPKFRTRWLKEEAPATFVAQFETTKGSFAVELHREYSPKAVDRMYQLVKHHYYDNGLFYRVVPKFVVQFGNSDSLLARQYGKFSVPDEEVKYGNKKGTISFARSGKESRATELFINLRDNPLLDTLSYEGVKGFPCFGNVIRGMDAVESLYSGYGDSTMYKYDTMYSNRIQFLTMFPKLDGIMKARIVK